METLEEIYPTMPKIQNNLQPTPIQEFYSNTSIFITGGTGFLGKVLIEKLLRSCPDIKTIYLLIREKKGKSAHQRIEEIFEDKIFARLKEEVPKSQHKIVPVSGDCTLAGLGLSIDDIAIIKQEVNIVFHVAATVRFDEKLKLAVAINVTGTKDILDLCRQMTNLKALVHVSTAYSNCHLKQIDEIFYQYPFCYKDLCSMLEKLDEKAVDQLTPKLLGKWPNTYSLTKAMAEALVRDNHDGLPLAMFRPAIVISTYREPIKGWIDNYYGPTGVCAAVMMGVLRTMHCDDEIIANIVPVDMCVNSLIACAWDIGIKFKENSQVTPPIYNFVSCVDKPISWHEYNKINMIYGNKYPLNKSVWTIQFDTHKSSMVNKLCMIFLHFLPAIFVDIFTLLTGRAPRMFSMSRKIYKFSEVISHFCTNKWRFTNDNVRALYANMDSRDKDIFDFDFKKLDWLEYFKNYILGIREHLFKEEINTVPTAKKRQAKQVISYKIIKIIFIYVAIYTMWLTLSGIFKTTCSIFGL